MRELFPVRLASAPMAYAAPEARGISAEAAAPIAVRPGIERLHAQCARSGACCRNSARRPTRALIAPSSRSIASGAKLVEAAAISVTALAELVLMLAAVLQGAAVDAPLDAYFLEAPAIAPAFLAELVFMLAFETQALAEVGTRLRGRSGGQDQQSGAEIGSFFQPGDSTHGFDPLFAQRFRAGSCFSSRCAARRADTRADTGARAARPTRRGRRHAGGAKDALAPRMRYGMNERTSSELSDMPLASAIRTIPDYPKPGIMFRDITTLLGDAKAFRRAVDELVQPWAGTKIDKVAGMEARGFILGGAVAHQLSAGFVPVRKKGKLPHATVRIAYSLEYGVDEMEVHEDAVAKGERVILVDDLIATGGTAEGAIKLLQQIGAEVVAACFVIDLPDLGGARKIEALGVPVRKLVSFEGH
jgi:adenine phosphoribosyltransferase